MTEFNPFFKKWRKGLRRVAIVYPNRYVGGISNIGIQRIYAEVNALDDFVAERFYTDVFEGLSSVESGANLKDFEIALFSIQYEEDIFSAVRILKKSEFAGLKIAGGPCVTENPRPFSKFFDGLFLGEADTLVGKILKGELELYPEFRKRRYWKELPEHPRREIIGEGAFGRALLLEIGRGCVRGCKFCVVRQLYAPGRWRDKKELLEVAEENRKFVDKVALIAPSPSDHPQFEDLIFELYDLGYRISPSSVRADKISEESLKVLAESGLESLTFAPETSERLRKVIGKDLSDEDILRACEKAKEVGIRKVKLYFMIGIPGEKEEDIEDIIKLVEKVAKLKLRVSVSVNPLVPKPHTPMQWFPFGGDLEKDVKSNVKELERKAKYLKAKLGRIAEVEVENVRRFAIQTVISRGDESVSKLIEQKPSFRLIFELGLDKFLGSFDVDRELPWEVVEVGYKKKRLLKEFEKIASA